MLGLVLTLLGSPAIVSGALDLASAPSRGRTPLGADAGVAPVDPPRPRARIGSRRSRREDLEVVVRGRWRSWTVVGRLRDRLAVELQVRVAFDGWLSAPPGPRPVSRGERQRRRRCLELGAPSTGTGLVEVWAVMERAKALGCSEVSS